MTVTSKLHNNILNVVSLVGCPENQFAKLCKIVEGGPVGERGDHLQCHGWSGDQIRCDRPKEKNLNLYMASLVNSCQGMGTGVLFRINYSIHQHTGTECDKVLDGGNYFQSC